MNIIRVTISFDKLFLSHSPLVTVIDNKKDFIENKNVLQHKKSYQEVNYNFDTSSNVVVGRKDVDIKLMGFVNAETEEELDNLECW